MEWDSFGCRDDEPIVLVMGLGAQMILWPEAVCEALARVLEDHDLGRALEPGQRRAVADRARPAAAVADLAAGELHSPSYRSVASPER